MVGEPAGYRAHRPRPAQLNDSLGLARELQGSNRRWHAKLNDALQSFPDLQERVHGGGGGDYGEGADPEER